MRGEFHSSVTYMATLESKNVFMYGWYQNNIEHDSCKINDVIKLLPYMFSEKNKIFSFRDWTFAMEKEKENTARIVIFRELGIINCYTLEATFYGSDSLGKVVYENQSSESIEDEVDSKDTNIQENEENFNNPDRKSKFHMHIKSEPNEIELDWQLGSDEYSKEM